MGSALSGRHEGRHPDIRSALPLTPDSPSALRAPSAARPHPRTPPLHSEAALRGRDGRFGRRGAWPHPLEGAQRTANPGRRATAQTCGLSRSGPDRKHRGNRHEKPAESAFPGASDSLNDRAKSVCPAALRCIPLGDRGREPASGCCKRLQTGLGRHGFHTGTEHDLAHATATSPAREAPSRIDTKPSDRKPSR